ncbi:hypothetical protein MKS88_002915 [Plasmodium brasilianum]|uniref:Uncharacterized protein n=1 Tax=Plasmodium brasilianum TaxID=5824 RepID=A0ACB9YA90_PLABR|nr:hypothetical protein MKS88_002915 [Plasmodium brasilianum]
MEEPNSERYILFEGENEVNHDNFCYEYAERTSRKSTSNVQSHKSLKNIISKQNKTLWKDTTEYIPYIPEITPKCSQRYTDLEKKKLSFLCSLCLLQSDLSIIGKHNLKELLNNTEKEKWKKIPFLWIHDYKATYSTHYTDEQRIRKKMNFIKNIMS